MSRYSIAPPPVIPILQDHLRAEMTARYSDATPVNMALKSGEQIVLIPAGGQSRTLVSSEVRVIVDCYAAMNSRAWQIASRVFALIADMDSSIVGGMQVYDVDLMPPYEYPHPDLPDLHRWQATYTIHVRHQPV